MIRLVPVVLVALVLCASAGAQQVLLNDDFSDLSNWVDLSKAVTWGGNTTPTSAFTTNADGAGKVSISSAGQAATGYGSDELRMFQCLDFVFDSPVDISDQNAELNVTFNARWDNRSLSNEGSRFNVFYTYDYPEGGMDLTLDDKYNDFSDHWWGRPAYNMRIRHNANEALLIWGGGTDTSTNPIEGEFEHNDDFWMPGFSSSPGGNSPQPGVFGCEGAGAGNYSQSEYKQYQYILKWDEGDFVQQLWYDGAMVGEQIIANATETYNGDDYLAQYDTIEGIRLFWRAAGDDAQAILDDISVTYVPEPATLAVLGLGGIGVLLRRRRG
ncbi:MAG: PEP-CTERM sorting domain-containing protein [Phycisphaerae bacterium]